MKKFFEGLKDLLYDSIDYIIVLSIISIVALIIGWRIDLLFANDALSIVDTDNQVVHEDSQDSQPIDTNLEKEDIHKDMEDDENTEVVKDTIEEKDQLPQDNTIVKVSIPAGSLPSKIGTILEDKGLVASKNEFVTKSQELNLDTKLKSGDYDIYANSSLEDIIHLIAK